MIIAWKIIKGQYYLLFVNVLILIIIIKLLNHLSIHIDIIHYIIHIQLFILYIIIHIIGYIIYFSSITRKQTKSCFLFDFYFMYLFVITYYYSLKFLYPFFPLGVSDDEKTGRNFKNTYLYGRFKELFLFFIFKKHLIIPRILYSVVV